MFFYKMMLHISFVSLLCLISSIASAQKQTLTIYTYDSFIGEWGPGPKLKAVFESHCQCNVTFKGFGDGVALLTHLRIKKDKTPADIIMGMDNNLLFDAQKTQALVSHTIDTASLSLPVKDMVDIFLPYNYGYFAFIYNTDKLSVVPSSFEELLQNQSLKFIMQDPRSSTPGLGLVTTIKKIYGSQSKTLWHKLRQHIHTVTPGWSEAYSLFVQGEADMVWSYITSQAYHESVGEGKQYKAIVFDKGQYIQVETATITKAGQKRHFALAKKFMTFLLTDKAQAIIANNNWMHSVTDYNNKLPDYFQNLPPVNTTLYHTPQTVSRNKKQWIEEWQNAVIN